MSTKRKTCDGLQVVTADVVKVGKTSLTSDATVKRDVILPDKAGTLSMIADVEDGFVSLDTSQSITGDKEFRGNVYFFGEGFNCGQKVVTQTGSNNSSVTINSASGRITMFTTIVTGVVHTFTVNNTSASPNSICIVSVAQGTLPLDSGVALAVWAGEPGSQTFKIQVYNFGPSTSLRPPVINFLLC